MKQDYPRIGRLVSAVLLLAAIPAAQASFAVQDVDEQPQYGNAQSTRFRDAISGKTTMSSTEQQELARLIPENPNSRFYTRVQALFGQRVLDNVSNRSLAPWLSNTTNVVKAVDNKAGLEFAWGYQAESLRADLSLLFYRELDYNASPVLLKMTPTSYNLTSQLKTYTLFANFYYDFNAFTWLQPYLTAGLGLSSISTNSTLTTANNVIINSQVRRNNGPAANIGAGIRSRVFSRLYLDLNCRYFALGAARWQVSDAASNPINLLGQISATTLGFGLLYLF
jgi:opacity protein-like surface antigen